MPKDSTWEFWLVLALIAFLVIVVGPLVMR
jgi:hypothetical protein